MQLTSEDHQNRENTSRYLEDKILLIDARSLDQKHSLINKLSAESPENYFIKSRLFVLEKKRSAKVNNLLSCANYHQAKNLNLALDCAALANKFGSSEETLNTLNSVHKAIEDRASRRQAIDQVQAEHERNSLMRLAKKQIIQPDYTASIATLNQLLVHAPDDKEAQQLLSQLRAIRQRQVSDLITMGDKFYRDEHIKQALAVWQAAAKLDADNREVASRIDRALKVIDKMDQIKEKSESSTN